MRRVAPVVSLVQALVTAIAAGQGPALPLKLSAFVSLTATANLNDPPDTTDVYRVFDTRAGELPLDVLELVVERPAVAAGDVGFRADLTAGSAIPHVTAARGLFRDPDTGEAEDFDLQQLYVSWIAPVGRGLRLDLGQYTSPLGYEGIEGCHGWNDTVSRSFTSGYATAATHTDVRAALPFSDAVTGSVWVVAGWDVVGDNNDACTLGAQLAVAPPGGLLSGSLTYFSGPEQDGDDEQGRDTVDLIVKLQATPALSFAADAIAGSEALAGGGETHSRAVVLYTRLQLGGSAALALRLERCDDEDGWRTGTPQVLNEVTLEADVTVVRGPHLLREVRLDRSDAAFSPSSGGVETTPATIALIPNGVDADLLGR